MIESIPGRYEKSWWLSHATHHSMQSIKGTGLPEADLTTGIIRGGSIAGSEGDYLYVANCGLEHRFVKTART